MPLLATEAPGWDRRFAKVGGRGWLNRPVFAPFAPKKGRSAIDTQDQAPSDHEGRDRAAVSSEEGLIRSSKDRSFEVVLTFTPSELAVWETLLSHWPTRRLARETGRSRNTLRRYALRVLWQTKRGKEAARKAP